MFGSLAHPARILTASATHQVGLFSLSLSSSPQLCLLGVLGSALAALETEEWKIRNSRYKAQGVSSALDGLLLTPRVSEVGMVLMLPAAIQKKMKLRIGEKQSRTSVQQSGSRGANPCLHPTSRTQTPQHSGEQFRLLVAPAHGPDRLTWEATSPHQLSIFW